MESIGPIRGGPRNIVDWGLGFDNKYITTRPDPRLFLALGGLPRPRSCRRRNIYPYHYSFTQFSKRNSRKSATCFFLWLVCQGVPNARCKKHVALFSREPSETWHGETLHHIHCIYAIWEAFVALQEAQIGRDVWFEHVPSVYSTARTARPLLR